MKLLNQSNVTGIMVYLKICFACFCLWYQIDPNFSIEPPSTSVLLFENEIIHHTSKKSFELAQCGAVNSSCCFTEYQLHSLHRTEMFALQINDGIRNYSKDP